MSRYQFQVGTTYQRSQIRKQLGLDPDAKGGSWYTGCLLMDTTPLQMRTTLTHGSQPFIGFVAD